MKRQTLYSIKMVIFMLLIFSSVYPVIAEEYLNLHAFENASYYDELIERMGNQLVLQLPSDAKLPFIGSARFSGGPHNSNGSWCATNVEIVDQSGLDFGGVSNVISGAWGKLIRRGWDNSGFGNVVIIEHSGGIQTLYAHLASFSNDLNQKNLGDELPRGFPLGIAGCSGGNRECNVHLHFGLRANATSTSLGTPVSWDGKVIDGWVVHSIRSKSTASMGIEYRGTATRLGIQLREQQGIVNGCGQIEGTSVVDRENGSNSSKLMSSSNTIVANTGATIYSTNQPSNNTSLTPVSPPSTITNDIAINIAFPWYFLIESGDSRIISVKLNENLLFSKPGCAKALWIARGSHVLSITYENQGADIPNVDINAWPFISPICAAEPADTPPTGTIPQPSPESDNAIFVSDLSLPDGSITNQGQTLTKTWRFKNTGTSTWGSDYQLVFISGEQMGAPMEIDAPSTAPNQEADLSVNLIAPAISGLHTGYWQLRNPQGTYFGPKVSVKINVQAQNAGSGHITVFDVSPASPSSANQVHIVGRIRSFTDFRSMRFVIGNEYYEMPNPKQVGDQLEISMDWQTGSLPRGNYAILFEVANNGDMNWSNPERRVITYTLDGSPTSQNRPPDRPVLNSPYNWYLKDNGGSTASVELCVNPSSDPDGNPVNYWFEVKDQGGGVYASSGWTNSTCWARTYDPNTYSWRVKAGDGSAESDWSAETWNFTVAKGGVYIGDITFFNTNTNDTHVCVPVNYDGIQAPDVYAWLNKANDGSETGEWRLLDHYGPNTTPDCTQPNVHGFWIRSPEYETGVHMLRVNAVKQDSGSNQTKTSTYAIAYIRPSYVNLLAPSTQTNNGTWWNTGAINFQWSPSLRAENYNLRASTDSDPWADPSPLLDVTLPGSQTSYSHTFGQDYPKLYWSVRATNSVGATDSGPDVWFGIDRVASTCQVQPLPTSTYENVFQVNWSGTDDSSGMLTYDVQYKDSERGDWKDWITNQSATKPYELFNGQPGHTYYYRCRGTDSANNKPLDYPINPDAWIKVDPQARPPEPWWNDGYTYKRNLTIQNNLAGIELPTGYPVLLHFTSGTNPTAAEVFGASLSSPKCNDIRIGYNNTTDLPRVVDSCTSDEIKIWFRTQIGIPGGGTDNTIHQIYYGNASPGILPAGRVFYPDADSNSLRIYDMREGIGTTLYDAAGHGDATMSTALSWTQGKWGPAVQFPTDDGPEPRPAIDDGSAYMPMNSFTVEFWLKRGPVDGGAIANQVVHGYPPRWSINIVDGHMSLSVWPWPGAGASGVRSDRNLNEATFYSQFHHFAVTFDGGNQVRFYIDGQLESAKTLSQTGFTTSASPLRIGASDINTARLSGVMSSFSLSEGVKTSFPDGYFASIIVEPTVLAGQIINPPFSGSADLTVQSLTTYPNPGGGILVEALVLNQGNMSTQNGFYTDLYLDHIPTASGDFTGSLQFWVNDPIDPGATATLSTVISDLQSVGGLTVQATSSFTETSGMIYAQTDSTGALLEADKSNNIYSAGTEICLASPDIYEEDDTKGSARLVQVGQSTIHNFDSLSDQDWLKFSAQAGTTYRIFTSNLGLSADTYLYLYGIDGTTLLISNDDYGGTLASQILWQAPANGTYYLLVQHWNPNASGCGTGYSLSIADGTGMEIYLPIISR